MGNRSKTSSATVLTSASIPLPRPKLATSFVPRPLTEFEIDWLRREGREFQEAYSQIKANLALHEIDRSVENAPIDIGVVIALAEEFREFVELFGSRTELEGSILTGYRFQHGEYRIIATFVGDMGEAHATQVTERMIAVWRPETIVTIGLAAAVHEELHIGDVYIPEKTIPYIQIAKALTQPRTAAEFRVVPGSTTYRVDDKLHAAVRHVESAYPLFRNACTQDLERLIPDPSIRKNLVEKNLLGLEAKALASGHIATGPISSSTESFSCWIRNHDREVKAIEMESSTAVWFAAQSLQNPTRSLAIRGISDYADERKTHSNALSSVLRRYAIRNAVRFLLTLMEAQVMPSRREKTTG